MAFSETTKGYPGGDDLPPATPKKRTPPSLQKMRCESMAANQKYKLGTDFIIPPAAIAHQTVKAAGLTSAESEPKSKAASKEHKKDASPGKKTRRESGHKDDEFGLKINLPYELRNGKDNIPKNTNTLRLSTSASDLFNQSDPLAASSIHSKHSLGSGVRGRPARRRAVISTSDRKTKGRPTEVEDDLSDTSSIPAGHRSTQRAVSSASESRMASGSNHSMHDSSRSLSWDPTSRLNRPSHSAVDILCTPIRRTTARSSKVRNATEEMRKRLSIALKDGDSRSPTGSGMTDDEDNNKGKSTQKGTKTRRRRSLTLKDGDSTSTTASVTTTHDDNNNKGNSTRKATKTRRRLSLTLKDTNSGSDNSRSTTASETTDEESSKGKSTRKGPKGRKVKRKQKPVQKNSARSCFYDIVDIDDHRIDIASDNSEGDDTSDADSFASEERVHVVTITTWQCFCGENVENEFAFCGVCGTKQTWECSGCGFDRNKCKFAFCGKCGVPKEPNKKKISNEARHSVKQAISIISQTYN